MGANAIVKLCFGGGRSNELYPYQEEKSAWAMSGQKDRQ